MIRINPCINKSELFFTDISLINKQNATTIKVSIRHTIHFFAKNRKMYEKKVFNFLCFSAQLKDVVYPKPRWESENWFSIFREGRGFFFVSWGRFPSLFQYVHAIFHLTWIHRFLCAIYFFHRSTIHRQE